VKIVRAAERRITVTPNATMTTVVSPSLGGIAGSLWWVEMNPGAENPEHAFGQEVVWAVTRGRATIWLGGEGHALEPGDTAVVPAGIMRRIVAGPDGFTAVATTSAPSPVTRADGLPAVVPPWVA
jgi:quercetin dioxygenase-like cupin family protein